MRVRVLSKRLAGRPVGTVVDLADDEVDVRALVKAGHVAVVPVAKPSKKTSKKKAES